MYYLSSFRTVDFILQMEGYKTKSIWNWPLLHPIKKFKVNKNKNLIIFMKRFHLY